MNHHSSTVETDRSSDQLVAMWRQERDELLDRIVRLEDELARFEGEHRCRRCSEPAPPLERWPGDARARDERPACTCGKQRAWSM